MVKATNDCVATQQAKICIVLALFAKMRKITNQPLRVEKHQDTHYKSSYNFMFMDGLWRGFHQNSYLYVGCMLQPFDFVNFQYQCAIHYICKRIYDPKYQI